MHNLSYEYYIVLVAHEEELIFIQTAIHQASPRKRGYGLLRNGLKYWEDQKDNALQTMDTRLNNAC